MAKIYRIHLIINAVGLKNVVVSESFAVYILLALLSFFLVYLHPCDCRKPLSSYRLQYLSLWLEDLPELL